MAREVGQDARLRQHFYPGLLLLLRSAEEGDALPFCHQSEPMVLLPLIPDAYPL